MKINYKKGKFKKMIKPTIIPLKFSFEKPTITNGNGEFI